MVMRLLHVAVSKQTCIAGKWIPTTPHYSTYSAHLSNLHPFTQSLTPHLNFIFRTLTNLCIMRETQGLHLLQHSVENHL